LRVAKFVNAIVCRCGTFSTKVNERIWQTTSLNLAKRFVNGANEIMD